jgi:Transposase DDE domain
VLLHGLSGEQTGVYFVDSTKLAVCHNRRIHRNKVFDGLAARGKTSMGWFYGLKLPFVINHKGQIVALKITSGNTADTRCWWRRRQCDQLRAASRSGGWSQTRR